MMYRLCELSEFSLKYAIDTYLWEREDFVYVGENYVSYEDETISLVDFSYRYCEAEENAEIYAYFDETGRLCEGVLLDGMDIYAYA